MTSRSHVLMVLSISIGALVVALIVRFLTSYSRQTTVVVPAIDLGKETISYPGTLAFRFSDKRLWAGFIDSNYSQRWAALEPVEILGQTCSIAVDQQCASIEGSPTWDASVAHTAYPLDERYWSQIDVPNDFIVSTSTVKIGPATVRVLGSRVVTAGFTTDGKVCWVVSGSSQTPVGLGVFIGGEPGRQYSRCVLQIFDVSAGMQIGPNLSLSMTRPWVWEIQGIHIAEHDVLILWDNFGSGVWIVRLREGTATPIPGCIN